MEDQSSTVSFCPSFSSYSLDNGKNHTLSTIAARVCQEDKEAKHCLLEYQNDDGADASFEFVFPSASTSLSQEQVNPLPLFNRDLFDADVAHSPDSFSPNRLVSLGKLFTEEEGGYQGEDIPSPSSLSEACGDDVVPGSYCLWKLNLSASHSPEGCKKSNSTGSSAAMAVPSKTKWRLRDFLWRSRSDGKESKYVFLNSPTNSIPSNNKTEVINKPTSSPSQLKKGKAKEKIILIPAQEAFYARKKGLTEVDKRRTYLPYRQDLVGGLFNGLGRTFSPF